MGLNEAVTNEYKKRGQNRIYDIRSEVYDVSEEAAQEVIEAGFVDYILEEADYAIELAKQNNADYAIVRIMNYVVDDAAVYPGEDNIANFEEAGGGIIGERTTLMNINGSIVLTQIVDRGEYKNYFVEDFAPAMAIAGMVLSEEGYNIDPNPIGKLTVAQKLLARLMGAQSDHEIYLDIVNVHTSNAFTLRSYCVDLRIKL